MRDLVAAMNVVRYGVAADELVISNTTIATDESRMYDGIKDLNRS